MFIDIVPFLLYYISKYVILRKGGNSMDSIAIWFAETLGQYIPAELVTFIVALFPVLECRGGIIVGRLLGLPLVTTIILSVVGNMLPIPFILLFIKRVFHWLHGKKFMVKTVEKLEERALKKSSAIRKGEFLGLLIFVGIPLPGTGGWTGALIADLLKVDLKKAIVAIFSGIIMATIIISFLMYGIF